MTDDVSAELLADDYLLAVGLDMDVGSVVADSAVDSLLGGDQKVVVGLQELVDLGLEHPQVEQPDSLLQHRAVGEVFESLTLGTG